MKLYPKLFMVFSVVTLYVLLFFWGVRPVHAMCIHPGDCMKGYEQSGDPYTVRPTYNGSGSQVYEVWGSSDVFGPFMAKDLADDVAYGLNNAHRERMDEEEYRQHTDEK
jgi:hypothetical protein